MKQAYKGSYLAGTVMWIDEFASHLKRSTVAKPQIDDALALKEAHLPQHLYKYYRVNSYGLASLRDDSVWICSPEAYNDPYDCLFRIAEADVVTAAKQGLLTQFVRIFKLKELLSVETIKAARSCDDPLARLVEAIPSDRSFAPGSDPARMAQFVSIRVPQMVQDTVNFIRQVRDATKVCSFTERNDSIIMWSHYAENHKGFCVEYDISQLPAQHQLRKSVFPVVYSARLFDLTRWSAKLMRSGRKQFNPALVLLAMIHKYRDWKYEREWRFVLTEPRLSADRSLSVPTPSRLFLGSRMLGDQKAEITGICKAKGIEVWQMERAFDAFELKSSRVA